MNSTTIAPAALIISDIAIRQDEQARYLLNDLHKAAGNEPKQKPSEWLRNKQAIELIQEIEKAGIPAIQSKQQLGTYAVKELIYAYAMWINPVFHLHVIRAYDALVSNHPLISPITTPLTLAQFNERQKALDAAQQALHKAQIIVTAADLLPKPTNRRKTKAIAPRNWTPEEVSALHEMRAQGHTFPHIAQQLGRTVCSVMNRYKHDLAKGGAQ